MQPVEFDFLEPASQDATLAGCDSLLLLRMLRRFSATPPVTRMVADLTDQAPVEFAQFVAAHRDGLLFVPAP